MDHWSRRAWHDLVWGSTCVGCTAPGPALCRTCRVGPRVPALRLLEGGVECLSAADHASVWGRAVVAHKEHGVRELGRPMSHLLAETVHGALGSQRGPAPGAAVLLVPVPSRPATLRERADDPWARVVRGAARALGRSESLPLSSPPVLVAPLLTFAGVTRDQGGLDAQAREANVRHALRGRPGALRVLARRVPGPVRVVVCDDVVTTGATLGEAVRALRATGVGVDVAVTVTSARLRGRR